LQNSAVAVRGLREDHAGARRDVARPIVFRAVRHALEHTHVQLRLHAVLATQLADVSGLPAVEHPKRDGGIVELVVHVGVPAANHTCSMRPSLSSISSPTTRETYGAKARLAELTNEMESIFGVFSELKPSGTKPRLAVIRLDPNARLRWTTMGVSLTRDNRGLLARLVGAPLSWRQSHFWRPEQVEVAAAQMARNGPRH
jgi:hypothetical protein